MTTAQKHQERRRPTAFLAAVAIAATAWWSASGTARADERTWSVKEVTGTARIQHGGVGWVALKVGDRVEPGSKVETAAGARLALARPGDSIDVASSSRFDVPATVDPKAKAPAHILQTMGTLLFKITTRPDHPFGVKTPYLAAVIKGTVFTVSVKGSESELHVTKGAVEVTSVITNQVVMVRPGMTAAINGAKGGQMQVIGERRGDNGKTGGNSGTAAANAKIKAAAAGSGAQVIPRSVGPQKINVFQSSGGLVRDLQNGPGNGQGRGSDAGNGKAVGNANGSGNGNAFGNSIASVGSDPVGGSGGLGNGNGLVKGAGNGLGNGVGNAVGGAASAALGAPSTPGGSSGPASGSGSPSSGGGTPPGLGGVVPPGLGGVVPPGQGGIPPGQGGTPPGQGKKG